MSDSLSSVGKRVQLSHTDIVGPHESFAIAYEVDSTFGGLDAGIALWLGSGDDQLHVTSTHLPPSYINSPGRATTALFLGEGDDAASLTLSDNQEGFTVIVCGPGDDVVDTLRRLG